MRTRNDMSDEKPSGTIDARSSLCRPRQAGRNAATIFSLLLACTVAAASFDARAGTNVSGPIAVNTTWSVAGAPYTVTGDVSVNGGAVLTIEAGVVVFMNAGTNLIINNGALSAIGSSNAPIVITSYRDIANPNPAPAPGDWGQLKFLSGTLAAGTSLSYVQVKFGSGVGLIAASPTLSNVSILNHNAPAISVDLQSSPVGNGLTASGNTLNGVLVPAGDIAGNVIWGLIGIPYVVAQGIVGIGAPPIAISPSSLSLNTNTTDTLHVAVASAAPAGGIALSVSSSLPAVASVPATVTVPQGATTVDVTVTALAVGTTTITVSGGGLGSATATVQVNSAPTLTLSPATGNVGVGQTLPMTVTSSSAAPAGGLAVALSSTNVNFVTVPTPVTIPANTTSAAFNATGVAAGAATITAQAGGYANGTAVITAQALTLGAPANLLVAPGLTVGLAVTLPSPAPAGGVTINLHSANAAIATVPASVNVAAGATTASVSVTGVGVGNTTITASATGYTSAVTAVAVSAITLDVQPSGTINIPQGVTQAYQLKLSAAAPVGGVTVSVASNGTSTATVSPSSVTIAQGQTLSTATVAMNGVATGATTITLSSPGLASKTVTVSVLAQGSITFNFVSTTIVGKNLKTAATDLSVQLKSGGTLFSSPVPVTMTLTSADASKVGVPTSVTIPAGASSASFQVTGVDLTSAPVAVGASGGGLTSATNLNVTVASPQLLLTGLDGTRTPLSIRDDFRLAWFVSGAISPSGQVSAADTAIQVALTNQNPAGIVSALYDQAAGGNVVGQVTISAGQSQSPSAYVGQPTTTGSYTVTATAPGIAPVTSATQNVYSAGLLFNFPFIIVGKTLTTVGDIKIFQTANNLVVPAAGDVIVTLTNTNPSRISVPATVTIPAGTGSTTFTATGIDLTTAAVSIGATAPGFQPPTPMTATVVAPQFLFNGLAGTRTLSSARNSFTVEWFVPGNTLTSSFQLSSADTPVSVAVTSQTPANVVSGIFDQASAGNPLSSLTIRAGTNVSAASGWIGQAAVPGTYTVTASVPGLTSTVSALQTVIGPTLTFNFIARVLGQGLYQDVSLSRSGDTLAPLTINLACQPTTLCSVAPTLSFAAGVSNATVRVTGIGLGSGLVQATAAGYVTGSGQILGQAAVLGFSSSLPSSLLVNGTANFTANVSLGPGQIFGGVPASNIVVTLVSTSSTVASVPTTVTIAAGASDSPSVQIHGLAPGTTTITASSPGYTGVTSGTITVGP